MPDSYYPESQALFLLPHLTTASDYFVAIKDLAGKFSLNQAIESPEGLFKMQWVDHCPGRTCLFNCAFSLPLAYLLSYRIENGL